MVSIPIVICEVLCRRGYVFDFAGMRILEGSSTAETVCLDGSGQQCVWVHKRNVKRAQPRR
jgi:hypothetical protein